MLRSFQSHAFNQAGPKFRINIRQIINALANGINVKHGSTGHQHHGVFGEENLQFFHHLGFKPAAW